MVWFLDYHNSGSQKPHSIYKEKEMRIVVLGDTHGRQFWKYVVNKEEFDLIVFLGDYLDSHHFNGEEQGNNLLDIIEYKKKNKDRVKLLLGNHDIQYWPGVEDFSSGLQGHMLPTFRSIFSANKDLFQMAYMVDDILMTHAGFAPTWIETLAKYTSIPEEITKWSIDDLENVINDLWKYKPNSFTFRSYGSRSDLYGDNPWQSPVWIRPKSLKADCQDIKNQIIQVVGHTGQSSIDIKGISTGGRYYFIDVLDTSGEYLIIEDGKFKTGKI